MSEDKLHPTVREFKAFMNSHPKLLKEVRRSGRGWQEHYEKWVLLGEDDPLWDDYKEASDSSTEEDIYMNADEDTDETQSDMVGKIIKLTENMDINKVQEQVHQLNSAISTIQEMIGQFQESKKSHEPFGRQNQSFNWFKD